MMIRRTNLLLATLVFVVFGITSCSEGDKNKLFPTITQLHFLKKTPLSTNTPGNTPTDISTNTQINPSTPTIKWNPEIIEIVPSVGCKGVPDRKQVLTAQWVNDNEFVYAYYPYDSEDDLTYNDTVMYWFSYNINSGTENISTPRINYDNSFWDRSDLPKNVINPELAGYFSPSGKYVIFNVWYGSVFDPHSRTEIWVAETKGQSRWKIYEFGFSNVHIYRAGWFGNETKVVFSATYEGQTDFYVSDILTGETTNLSDIAGFPVFSEGTWRLSPDGKTIALVNADERLLLISLETGKTRVVEEFGGSFPNWSEDGILLYYWWEKNGNVWDSVDELRVFNIYTGEIHHGLDKPSFDWGFRNLEVNDLCKEKDFKLPSNYAISPNGDKILLWENYLYLLSVE